jgi:polyisoprenoid-binding protein YceI
MAGRHRQPYAEAVAVAAGEYEIGPGTGRLLVRTFRQGMAARVGHDLLIEAAGWEGHVSVPVDAVTGSVVSVRVDLSALKVLEGTGGLKPLIQQTMHTVLQIDRHPHATFTSTNVDLHDDGASIEGDLTLGGQTRPLRLEVRQRDQATVVGTASLVQSRWGIKPYSGFFGALKLRDAVDLDVTVTLAAG